MEYKDTKEWPPNKVIALVDKEHGHLGGGGKVAREGGVSRFLRRRKE